MLLLLLVCLFTSPVFAIHFQMFIRVLASPLYFEANELDQKKPNLSQYLCYLVGWIGCQLNCSQTSQAYYFGASILGLCSSWLSLVNFLIVVFVVAYNLIQLAWKGPFPLEEYTGPFSSRNGAGEFKWAVSYGLQLSEGLSSKVRKQHLFFWNHVCVFSQYTSLVWYVSCLFFFLLVDSWLFFGQLLASAGLPTCIEWIK